MNILFYHKCVIDPQSGGISKITYTLAEVFKTYNHNVYFLSEIDTKKSKLVNIQYVLPNKDVITEENITYFQMLLNEKNIDIVINQYALHAVSSTFLELCKKKYNFKLVSCFHNSILTPIYNFAYQKEYILKKNNLSCLYKLLKTNILKSILTKLYIKKHRAHYHNTVKSSDAVVSLCEGLRDELFKIIGENFDTNHYVIPNCVQVPNDCILNKRNEIIWVGTFDNCVKRPDVMLDVWSQINEECPYWTLRFLGDGPSYVEMKNLAERNKLKNVIFEGRVCPEEYYKKAKVICLTSTHESFSLVIVEAKNHGVVPVIMNTFPATKIIVKDGVDGLLVNNYDKDKFAQSIVDLLSNPLKLDEMSKMCLLSKGQFSPELIYKHWNKLFLELNCI